MSRIFGWVGALALVLFLCTAHAADYDYVAVTKAPRAIHQGGLRTPLGFQWQCSGNRCAARGPWPKPGVAACHELARAVGELRSYGRAGAQLSASQMRQCNAGVAKPMAKVPGSTVPTPGRALPATGAGDQPSAGDGRYVSKGPEAVAKEVVAQTALPAQYQGRVALQGTGGVMWTCTGSRCARPANGARAVSIMECQQLAWSVGRISSVRWPGGEMGAPDLAACARPQLTRIEINTRSGEDDLRRNSVIEVRIVDNNLREGVPVSIFREGVGKRARGSAEISFGKIHQRRAAQEVVNVGLKRIKFKFRSGSTGALDSADNWDMAELTVRARLREVDGAVREVVLVGPLRGNPVRRFRDNDEWEVDVKPGALGG